MLGGSIFWKAVVKSFDVIGNGLAWMIGNGRKLRVGEDPWTGCVQQHKLLENIVLALRQSGIFFLHQLVDLVQMVRWEQSWTRAGDLGLAEPETWDLERYLRALSRDHIILRDREGVLIWDATPNGNYTPKTGYINLSAPEVDKDVVWWWKSLENKMSTKI